MRQNKITPNGQQYTVEILENGIIVYSWPVEEGVVLTPEEGFWYTPEIIISD